MRTSKRIICCILSIVMLLGVFANGFAYAESGEAAIFQFVQDQYTLCVGEMLSVSAVDPFSDGQTYFMNSSDSSVLYVNEDAEIVPDDHNISETIIGISAGWALLSVTSSDGRSRQCRITVKDNYILSAENFLSNHYPTIEGRLYRDTPSKICLDNLGETSFQTAIAIYDTMNNVSSFLGNIGTIYDKAIERKDVYLTVLLDILGASSVFESIDNEVAREVMNAKAYFSLISKAMKTGWDIEIKSENGFSSLTSTQKDAFLAYSNDWFKEVHPIAAASKEVSSALSSAFDSCKSFEEYYNYLVKCGVLYDAGSTLEEVLDLMRYDSRVSSDRDLQAAIDECYGIIQSNISAVGLQKAILNASSTAGKNVLGAIWWSGVSSSLYEAYPAVAVLQLVFQGEKLILNNVVNVDSLRKLYLEMVAITRLEEISEKTLTTLINRFDREHSSEASQELLLALNIVYNMRIKDCELALEFVEVSDQNLLEQLRSLIFGKDRDLQEIILQWKQEYAQDLTNINSFSPAKQLNDNQTDKDDQDYAQKANIVNESEASPGENTKPAANLLASGTCGADGDNLTWKMYDDGRLVIEGSGKMADYLFQEGYPDQAAPWLMVSLSKQIDIERVEIANGVTSIGDCAFASFYCGKLSTVVIPDTITKIGTWGFSFLTGLKSIILPNSITYIGDYAFGETGLTDVYYKGSEAEWNAVQKSVQDGLGLFSTHQPPTIHFQGGSAGGNSDGVSSQYRESYRAVIENMIESSAAEKANWNRTAYGMLVDLDDDGIDELVIIYRRDLSNVPTVLCDLYDIEDGQFKTVLEKLEVVTEVAGKSCKIAVVSYQGKTYLALSTDYGWAVGMYTQESTRLIDCLTGKETVFLHKWFQSENTREDNTYSIGGISCSAADYEVALGQIQTLASLDISGGQNTLDELLKTLSSGTGKSAGDWQRPYTDYLSKLSSRSDAKYVAIYMLNVDADDVPELLIELPTNAEGARLCYTDGNSVQEQSVYSYSFSYIPGSGLFRENGGHMDEYYDSIYRLENGSVQMIAHGEYGAEDNANVQRDAAGAPIYNYFWNGSRVDQASYYNMLNALFDTSREVSPYGGQSMSVEQALNELGTKQLVASAVSSAGKPGPDDLKGQDGVASPTSGWLAEYQIKYVKGTTSGNAYLRWSPSNEGREYKRYVKEGEKVTVLASENGYSLVLASDGRAGWVTSKLLA